MDLTDIVAAPKRYAAWLAWGTRVGLALLAIGFALYAGGFIEAHVPIERTAALWGQPAAEMLKGTGSSTGWSWAAHLPRSDILTLAAVALLAGCSVPCLAATIPAFVRRRERILVAICVLQIAVLVLAASGLLAGSH